jgi:TonB family protein
LRRTPLFLTLFVLACATPAPPPAPPAPAPVEEPAIGSVRVTAGVLNVRGEPSMEAEVIGQVRRGDVLTVLASGEAWLRVRAPEGAVGWVAERFVSTGAEKRAAKDCPDDSDYAFAEAPGLAFSEKGAHGMVVVEATVDATGNVTATRLISNATSDEALGTAAQREIEAAKFLPPIRDCAPREFIFTYRRTF